MARKKGRRNSGPAIPTQRQSEQLDRIDDMRDAGEFDRAYDEIVAFTGKHSQIVEGWALRFEIASFLGEHFSGWEAAQQVYRLVPDAEASLYNYIYALMQMMMPFTAAHYATRYLEKYPKGNQAETVEEMLDVATATIADIINNDPSLTDATEESLLALDRGQTLAIHGEYAEAHKSLKKAARLLPNSPTPQNAIVNTYVQMGDYKKALRAAEYGVKQFPNNAETCSLVARMLLRMGRQEAAEPHIERLLEIPRENPMIYLNVAKALAFIPDGDGLITLYEEFEKAHNDSDMFETIGPSLMVLAGTAHYEQGRTDDADDLWEIALDLDEDNDMADTNLYALDAEPGSHVGPAYIPADVLIPQGWLATLEKATRNKTGTMLEYAIGRVVKKTEGMLATFALCLRLGDGDAIYHALHMAKYFPLTTLVDFALGARGTDYHRIKAARLATRHGLLAPDMPITMLIDGEPTEITIIDLDVTHEQIEDSLHSEALQEVIERVHGRLLSEAFEAAITDVEEALVMFPGNKTLMNYKYAALMNLGQREEAAAMGDEMMRLHPDYLFSKVSQFNGLMDNEQYDEAADLLGTVEVNETIHASEFAAIASMQITLADATDKPAVAKQWVSLWKELDRGSMPAQYAMRDLSSGVADMMDFMAGLSNSEMDSLQSFLGSMLYQKEDIDDPDYFGGMTSGRRML
ncbi:MAG: tetratricopeptide repeat protein [Chloroflexota bacterium]